ncbi:DUF5712 family protein [Hymenobacter monticola]|uniref:DUF5712 family protein n=1 Tax=Hymenobacter monticola TaxID=1705399 RepID=A0ABY4BBA6_9BACT|nr:DUF5712 family protein [Hymenobacter monticola]UOE36457.1 DUF5712 family protein [Hymenobacter monticola]
MYAKVINPATNGRKVYNNAGSSQRCASYLAKEAKEAGGEATFFGAPGTEPKTAAEVVETLDGNVKGLGKDDPKFHSLVLSPSTDELLLIGNDPKALEHYTQNVMDLYAKNFTLKNGKELGESNLVWAATIHQERKNRGTDEGVQGEKKEGLQTHVHVMVSARDADQKITLNPLGRADRFSRVQFQAEAVTQMEVQFGRVTAHDVSRPQPTRPQLVAQKKEEITRKAAANRQEKKPLTPEQMAAKDARLDGQVARLNSKLDPSLHLDASRVKSIAKERQYDQVFYSTLGQIERNAEKGKYTPDPYGYLTTGRVSRLPQLRMDGGLSAVPEPQPAYSNADNSPQIRGGSAAAFALSIQRLSRAMVPPTRTQDVRSEAEKKQESEQEWEW